MSPMKWTAGIVALLAMLIFGAWAYNNYVTNPRVVQELIDDPTGARAARVTMLTLPSGRQLPANYLREGDEIFIGADGPWWREFRDGGPARLLIQGEEIDGTGRVVLDDPAYVEDVFSRLRPAAPEWLPAWLNGRLIVITINQ